MVRGLRQLQIASPATRQNLTDLSSLSFLSSGPGWMPDLSGIVVACQSKSPVARVKQKRARSQLCGPLVVDQRLPRELCGQPRIRKA